MYFPTICVKCHYELRRVRIPSPPNTYAWKKDSECPVCDGTEGYIDTGWMQHKELKNEDIPFLRFMHGKSPYKDTH
jgi:hypothetical protein